MDAVPVLLSAILITFAFHSTLQGAESMQATIEYMMKRQPLAFDDDQPKRLLEKAEVSDRVVYDDILNIVPFYFINGAMKLGAIYYPVIKATPDESFWMERPDLRFGVFYNPLISLPGLQGNNPEKWWISLPQYRFSPISAQRKSYQVAVNGQIPVSELYNLRLKIQKPCDGNQLILQLSEIHQNSFIDIIFFSDSEVTQTIRRIDLEKSAKSRIAIELPPNTNELEMRFSPGSDFFLSGLNLSDDGLLWPWSCKGTMVLNSKSEANPITVTFDIAQLVPKPLRNRSMSVIDDKGCSVLVEFGPDLAKRQ
jgi:hypothetical protein